jgi:hypothetical protein
MGGKNQRFGTESFEWLDGCLKDGEVTAADEAFVFKGFKLRDSSAGQCLDRRSKASSNWAAETAHLGVTAQCRRRPHQLDVHNRKTKMGWAYPKPKTSSWRNQTVKISATRN